jgi:hypothetical protein
MRRDELIALTALETGLPKSTAAKVLKGADEVRKAAELGGDRPSSRKSSKKGTTRQQSVAREQSKPVEPAPGTLERAALEKAEAAFGSRGESDQGRRMYAERSGLLA